MKAVTYTRFGAARDVLELVEMDTVSPGDGEVVVRLAYSGVNPSDVKRRAGSRPGMTAADFSPVIPHSDGAGVIEAVGPGVDKDRIGQRVWIWNGQWDRDFGTCAETITLPGAQAVPLLDGIDLKTGAVLGIPGLTACHTVFNGGEVAGKTVLVHGAAGTVGFLAVQLAKWGGARVIATARGAGADRVRKLGVDAVVDFTAPNLADAILAANNGAPIDRIIDPEFGANIDTNTDVIAPNGEICGYGSVLDPTPTLPFMPLMFKAVTVDLALVYILTDAQRSVAISRLNAALQEGALNCPIEQVFALTETAQAHEAVEAGKRSGAILVQTGAE